MSTEKSKARTGFLIHDVSRLRRTIFDQRFKDLGSTRSQWWVLSHLSRHENEGYTQIELARLLDISKVSVAGLIDRLEEGGFVTRKTDKEDRRSNRVLLSAKGHRVIEKLKKVGEVVNAEIMDGISDEEEAILNGLLSKMKQNLIKMEAVPADTLPRPLAATRKAAKAKKSAPK